MDRFDFFTEYRLRHVWLIYDVICHDSYLMSHKIPNFSISQVFWRLYVIGKQKKGKQIQIHFALLWLLYESYIYESYLVLKQTVWSIIKLKKNRRLTTWWGWRDDREKYMKPLCSATTWMFFFSFFTWHWYYHGWLTYDVICHDLYLMSHKIPFFQFSRTNYFILMGHIARWWLINSTES